MHAKSSFSSFLPPALLACAAIQFACDSQVGADYPGEPLATVHGEVSARDGGNGSAPNVAVLWFSSSEEQECSGPALACGYSVGGDLDSNFECIMACPEPLECAEDQLMAWSDCVSACDGEVEVDFETNWELCVDTAVGEMVDVTGEFPAAFTLDLFQPPPAEAMLAGDDGIAVALGLFIAADPEAGPVGLQEDPSASPPAGIVGGSEGHMLIYAADPVPAESPWGQMLGGSYAPGYHVLEVIDGGKECGMPGWGDECAYYTDELVPAPDDLATPIELILGSFDQIEWPAVG